MVLSIHNAYVGPIPTCIGTLKKLAVLKLSENFMNGTFESICELGGTLTYLNLMENEFEGAIPACISSLNLLIVLYLGDNHELSGEFPVEICDLVNLEILEIYETSVKGII
jgi:hypothetical protein